MDMKKAFDLVKQSTMFEKLFDRKIPAIFLRLLLKMYSKQQTNVRWNGNVSKTFPIKNGVKQGAVLSPRLYCTYIDGLFDELKRRKTVGLEKHFVVSPDTRMTYFSYHQV